MLDLSKSTRKGRFFCIWRCYHFFRFVMTFSYLLAILIKQIVSIWYEYSQHSVYSTNIAYNGSITPLSVWCSPEIWENTYWLNILSILLSYHYISKMVAIMVSFLIIRQWTRSQTQWLPRPAHENLVHIQSLHKELLLRLIHCFRSQRRLATLMLLLERSTRWGKGERTRHIFHAY